LKIIKIICKLLTIAIVAFSLLTISVVVVATHTASKEGISDARVQEIYNIIIAQTGQSQDALPLQIVNANIVNAYNDGFKVVIYRGIINYVQNEDELALIIGHEVAHGMLKHVYYPEFSRSADEVAVAEANADKLGAYYIIKGGFDICKAREFWKRMRKDNGNYLGQDHPDYSYRYDELGIGCTK